MQYLHQGVGARARDPVLRPTRALGTISFVPVQLYLPRGMCCRQNPGPAGPWPVGCCPNWGFSTTRGPADHCCDHTCKSEATHALQAHNKNGACISTSKWCMHQYVQMVHASVRPNGACISTSKWCMHQYVQTALPCLLLSSWQGAGVSSTPLWLTAVPHCG
jgi:hypothetical protein